MQTREYVGGGAHMHIQILTSYICQEGVKTVKLW